MTLRTISYGGGVQSTAMVVLAALRDPDFEAVMGGRVDAALFSNVGDDSEHPASLAYVREVAQPWAAERGLPVHELQRTRRDGTPVTLHGLITDPDRRSVAIPVRLTNGAPGSRSCTVDFKIKVVGKWLKAHGASRDNPATVAIGISTDEIQRAGSKKTEPYQQIVYPLIELGLSRNDCMNLIARADLPVPPKSSCFFCPYHRPQVWAELRRDEPDLFWKSVELERTLNKKQAENGKQPVWLTDRLGPLDEVIAEAQDTLPGFESLIGEDGCDSGYCWT